MTLMIKRRGGALYDGRIGNRHQTRTSLEWNGGRWRLTGRDIEIWCGYLIRLGMKRWEEFE